MNKRQLIDEIRQFNTSVRTEFLIQFDEQALAQYLSSLQSARQKRGARTPVWVRQQPRLKMVG